MKVLRGFKKVIHYIENVEAPFLYFILTFLFIITIRNFIESYSDSTPMPTILYLLHYYTFYIALALAMILLFHFAVRSKIKKIARLVLTSFFIIILPPILDLLISKQGGYDMAYLLPGKDIDLLQKFLTFFGSFNEMGITPGMRIEIALVVLATFFYVLVKKRSVIRAFIFSILNYALIFIFVSMPFVVKGFLKLFGIDFNYSWPLMRNFYLLLILILGAWVLYLYRKKYFIAIFKDLRMFRLLHYELMFILGIVFGKMFYPNLNIQLTGHTLFSWIFIPVGIMLAWIFAIITNNIVDYKIDLISNKSRPLVTGAITLPHYKTIGLLCFILCFLYLLAVHFIPLFIVMLFLGSAWLHDMPPLRLKRVPILANFTLAFNALILMMLGYGFVTGFITLPGNIVAFILIFFTAVINFIDIKDYHGDKTVGIKTLPTMLGLKKSKIVIGVFFFLAYISSYLVLKNIYLLILFTVIGLLQFYFINKKKYSEKPIFITYLSSIIILIIYILITL
ncbi:UbiA family prenyltransferase [bacterium]|nr:UbiA family prenyltransferase [bacterium]